MKFDFKHNVDVTVKGLAAVLFAVVVSIAAMAILAGKLLGVIGILATSVLLAMGYRTFIFYLQHTRTPPPGDPPPDVLPPPESDSKRRIRRKAKL